jgi:hypothetical protein
MRAAWRVALPEERDRLAAYALDAVAVEFVFVVGPLIVALLLVSTPLPVPLLVTACLLAGGSVAYSRAPAVRAWRPEPHPDGEGAVAPSPIALGGVRMVLVAALLVAAGFGQVDVSIAATAREALGDPGRVGLLFACIAGGSTLGGLWYGSRHWAGPERRRLPVALTGVTVGLAAVAVLLGAIEGVVRRPPFAVLAVLLVVAGMCIAPALIAVGNLVDALSPRSRLSEAQAWLSTMYTGGGAAGTALAGVVVDTGGPGRSFAGACFLMLVAMLATTAGQRRFRAADRAPALAVH